MKASVRLTGIILGLLISFPLWIVAIFVLKIFDKGALLTPRDVEQSLERMLSGEADEYWWDDFLNVPIRDKQLDEIRKECNHIWIEGSDFLDRDADGTYRLNALGISMIKKLVARCKHFMKTQIHVYMPDEAVDVWRPVEAERVGENRFRIFGSVPEDEIWEFQPGDTVRCEMKTLMDGVKYVERLVAVELSPES